MPVIELERPEQPLGDKNKYKSIRLENGIEALLISVGDEDRVGLKLTTV